MEFFKNMFIELRLALANISILGFSIFNYNIEQATTAITFATALISLLGALIATGLTFRKWWKQGKES